MRPRNFVVVAVHYDRGYVIQIYWKIWIWNGIFSNYLNFYLETPMLKQWNRQFSEGHLFLVQGIFLLEPPTHDFGLILRVFFQFWGNWNFFQGSELYQFVPHVGSLLGFYRVIKKLMSRFLVKSWKPRFLSFISIF